MIRWKLIRISEETAIRLKEIKHSNSYDKAINTLINRNTTKAMLEHHRNEILKKIRGEVETALFNVKGN